MANEKESEKIERDGFVFYKNWWKAVSIHKDAIKLEVLTAIIEYGLFGKLPEHLGEMSESLFIMAQPTIDSNNKRYQGAIRGGRPKRKSADDEGETGNDDSGNDDKKTNGFDNKKPMVSKSENLLYKDKVKDNLSLRDDGGTSSAEREIFIAKKILFFEKGIIQPQKEAERFFNHYRKTGWNDANGNEVRNKWAALRNWDAKPKELLPDGQGETWSVFCNIASDTNFERQFIDGIYGMRFKDGELEIKCRKKTMQAIEDKMEQNKERIAKWKQAYLPTTDITYTLL